MRRYDIDYTFQSVRGNDDEYDYSPMRLENVSEETLNSWRKMFWVKILSVTEAKTNKNALAI